MTYTDTPAQILFFSNRPSVQAMQQKFALYADKFPVWAAHSDGKHAPPAPARCCVRGIDIWKTR